MASPFIQTDHIYDIDPLKQLPERICDKNHLLYKPEQNLLVEVCDELTNKTDLFPNLPQCDTVKVYIEAKTNPRNYLSILGLEKEYKELCELSRELEINGLIDLHKEANDIINEMAKLKEVAILGEYISEEHKIILYIETIQNSATNQNIPCEAILSSVYVHEMMHAYFDRDDDRKKLPYIMEIEEPLAEAGVLLFAEQSKYLKSKLNDIKNSIKNNIYPYRLGSELFDKHNTKTKDIIKKYKNNDCADELRALLNSELLSNRIKNFMIRAKNALIQSLNNNAVFQLSLSSKELFHSNFLYWLANSQTSVFNYILRNCFAANFNFDPTKHVALREYKNIDFCICEKVNNVDYGEILFVLENKFKSIPYKGQLDKYKNEVDAYNNKFTKSSKRNINTSSLPNTKFVLLSLAKNVYGLKIQQGFVGCWKYVTYGEYAKSLKNAITIHGSSGCCSFSQCLIEHYQSFIQIFSYYMSAHLPSITNIVKEKWNILSSNVIMKDLRTDDIWQKLVAGNIAAVICNQLKTYNITTHINCSIKDIFSQKVKSGEVCVGVGFTRGTALIDIKKKISSDLLFGIQIQNGYYKRYLETKTTQRKPQVFFAKSLRMANFNDIFNWGKSNWQDLVSAIFVANATVHPNRQTKAPIITGFGKYGNSFIYQSKKLANAQIGDIVNSVCMDITRV